MNEMNHPAPGHAAETSAGALPEAAQRVAGLLAGLGHDKPVVMLPATGKTSAEAAAGLGCSVAEIAKSIIF
ncbi:YbaK/EbsC family protein, partial [Cupriavidus basilensis]|nr:YbaK/EbsC family protein [Cupriavidus basilensis]